MFNLVEVSGALTMSSLELVEFTNRERLGEAAQAGLAFPSKGFAKLEHADFMKKVPEVLGVNAGKFSGIYLDIRNREQDCYNFPKREACLMAMSYSYDIQAKIFDRWQELEESNRQRTENLAFREAYNLTKEEYLFIRQVGKEVAAVSTLINPILDDIEAKVAAMAFNPIAASKLKNDLYNNALARVFRLLKDSEVKQRQLASLDHKAYLAARKDLIDISKYTKEQRLLMQNQAKTRTSVEDVVVADMAKLANIESLLKLQKESKTCV